MVSFRRIAWPLPDKAFAMIVDVFRYVTFTIAYRNDMMMTMLTIVLGVITLALLTGVIICTLLNQHGSTAIPIFAKIVNIGVVLLSGIFYIPAISVFIGSL
jgi:hypothetical protein